MLAVFIAALSVSAAWSGASAASAVEGDFEYVLIKGGSEAEVTSYNGAESDVVVPDRLGGRPVTALGDWAFTDNTAISSIHLPDTLNAIGAFAFLRCSALLSIGVSPGNANLSSSEGVLYDKSFATLVRYPTGVVGPFSVPEGVTAIGEWAFVGCGGLSSVTLPLSLQAIRSGAFARCGALVSVSIPANVTEVGEIPFGSCASLVNIDVHGLNPAFASYAGDLYDKGMTVLIQHPGGIGGAIALAENTTRIASGAFQDCRGVVSVVIPRAVVDIGGYAFADCTSLRLLRFEGDAPSCGPEWVLRHSGELVFCCHINATGFTDPWEGVRTVRMVAPGPPQLLSAIAGAGNVTLTWAAPASDGSGPIVGFTVYYGLTPQTMKPHTTYGPGARAAVIQTLVQSWSDLGNDVFKEYILNPPLDYVLEDFVIEDLDVEGAPGILPAIRYCFAVLASNQHLGSALSNVLAATPYAPPSAPLNVTAIAGPQRVTISWSPPSTDGGSQVTGYTVFRVLPTGSTPIAALSASALSYVDMNVTAGDTYTYMVAAANAAGLGLNSSMVSAVPMQASEGAFLYALVAIGVIIAVAAVVFMVMRVRRP
jgi:hypothetical protein